MNLFVLDYDIPTCSKYHVNRHVVKMILETTQLLNNALIAHDKSYIPVYRPTHKNHPCSLWTSESRDNFTWLLQLGLSLCSEYTYRYDKIHKCQSILTQFSTLTHKISAGPLTPFKLCMPAIYHRADAVESYRLYYKKEKSHIAQWSKRETPYWWNS